MKTPDDLESRLARLRAEWPADSMVDEVMARIGGPAPPRRVRRRARLFAGLAASGLIAALGLAWLFVASRPTTLLAAVKDSLERARSAHLVITVWNDRGESLGSEEIWYRRGEGLRVEEPNRVIVEDGKAQWSWQTGAGETVVIHQRSPGFFTTGLASMLTLPDIPGDWAQARAPKLDRVIDGRACRGFTIIPPWGDPHTTGNRRAADGQAHRALVLAEDGGRIREITLQRRPEHGPWRPERAIRIEYDVPVAAEKVAARFPPGARVVDTDEAFHSRYPIDRALHRVVLGGLILAVHDVRPLKDGGGFYVVSSVRGTAEFLKAYPPRLHPVREDLVLLDVAFQPMSNQMQGAKYDRIVLGSATREGIEFSWWLIVPRRFFQVKDGKRVYLPANDESAVPGEPGRLDDLPGKARVPLSATYHDERHREANGAQQGVSTWTEVLLPPDGPPTTLDEVVTRARRDLLLMGAGGAGRLMGVAADTKSDGPGLRGLSQFAPESISDADFAAAVRRGLEDLNQFDEVHDPGPEERLPPLGGKSSEH